MTIEVKHASKTVKSPGTAMHKFAWEDMPVPRHYNKRAFDLESEDADVRRSALDDIVKVVDEAVSRMNKPGGFEEPKEHPCEHFVGRDRNQNVKPGHAEKGEEACKHWRAVLNQEPSARQACI